MDKKYSRYYEFLEWFEALTKSGVPSRVEDSSIVLQEEFEGVITCRLPLILRGQDWKSLSDLQKEIENPGEYALVLMQAGRASIAIACEDEILYSKQIQKYMVRKSQGKAQLNYLNEKGKSRLGSRIRLRQSQEFFDEIDAKLKVLNEEYAIKQIFLSCTPKLKGFWYQSSKEKIFDRKDPRWRRVPFMLHAPGQDEMFRIHRLLCRAAWNAK